MNRSRNELGEVRIDQLATLSVEGYMEAKARNADARRANSRCRATYSALPSAVSILTGSSPYDVRSYGLACMSSRRMSAARAKQSSASAPIWLRTSAKAARELMIQNAIELIAKTTKFFARMLTAFLRLGRCSQYNFRRSSGMTSASWLALTPLPTFPNSTSRTVMLVPPAYKPVTGILGAQPSVLYSLSMRRSSKVTSSASGVVAFSTAGD